MVEKKDIQISKIIVNSILKNLDTTKDKINVLYVELLDEDKILELELDKNEFEVTLKENLVNFEKSEDYDTCILIREAINKLKSYKNEQDFPITKS